MTDEQIQRGDRIQVREVPTGPMKRGTYVGERHGYVIIKTDPGEVYAFAKDAPFRITTLSQQ